MKSTIKNILLGGLLICSAFTFSCKNLTDLNVNPNGTTPDNVNPVFLMTEVQTEIAKDYLELNYGKASYFAPMMQQTQLDAFSDTYNDYDWSDQSWSGYYALLRSNKTAYDRAKDEDNKFIMGVSLTLKSFIFGLITDLWGDAPYTHALNGSQGGTADMYPAYDDQKTIYMGIISDLKKAGSLFATSGNSNVGAQDVYYQGDAKKWQQFANSLLLRYYMRISSKLPDVAKEGIQTVVASGIYFKSSNDDATMSFPGTNNDNSWPYAVKYDNTSGSNFRRVKMCSVFVDTLEAYNDPRLGIWAAKVQIPIKIDANFSTNPDTIINGVRYIHPGAIPAGTLVDTDPDYVGIPPSIGSEPSWYNLNPTPGQLSHNPHVSFMNDRYKNPTGPLLKARLISCAEVDFILAEAALKGWSVGKSAGDWYNAGIKASFDTWGVGADYSSYINGSRVKFDGTLKQIIKQKWIASWTTASEAWCDYRRTGYPALKAGPTAKRKVLPVRFVYSSEELSQNTKNVDQAMNDLKITNFSNPQGENSPWSKIWLIQGTNKPW